MSEYLKILEELKSKKASAEKAAEFVFRGQPCDKPLLPMLSRTDESGRRISFEKRYEIERRVFAEFKRTWPAVSNFRPESDWDFLAVAQHYRICTPLLDWTRSALAALWFAVGQALESSGKPPEPAIVWLLPAEAPDFVQEYQERGSPFDLDRTRFYRPRVVDRRIAAQQGMFSVHKTTVTNENLVPLEQDPHYKDRLEKLIIGPVHFPTLRENLDLCGVNALSLFPDPEGLSEFLKGRYTRFANGGNTERS